MKDSLLSVNVPTAETKPSDISDLKEEAGPLTPDPKLVILTCLLILASLTAVYVASEIVLPIILAFVLKLLFQPAMRQLEKLRIPRLPSALLVILTFFGLIVGLGAAVSGPAASWAGRLPEGIERLQQRLHFLSKPIQTFQNFMHQIDGGQADAGFNLSSILLQGTQHFASGLFETILILLFLLISGDTFLRRTVEIIPRFSDKRQMVALSQKVEKDISTYLVTITVMNGLVGIATGTAMWATGLGDPILWGVLAFILNYVPIIGPFAGVATFVFVGLLGIDGTWTAFLPAGLYLLIHLIEGELITPILLARRFTLNPVLVILSLIFWFWMWGVPGAILAVPMLAILKIICDGIVSLNSIGHFLEG